MIRFFWQMGLIACLFFQIPCVGTAADLQERLLPNDFLPTTIYYRLFETDYRSVDPGSEQQEAPPRDAMEDGAAPAPSRSVCDEEGVVTDHSYTDFMNRLDAKFRAMRNPYPPESIPTRLLRIGLSITGGIGAGVGLCSTFMVVSGDDFHIPKETNFAIATSLTVFPFLAFCYGEQYSQLIKRFVGYCKQPSDDNFRVTYNYKTLGRRAAKVVMGASALIMSLSYVAQMAYYQGKDNLLVTAIAGPFYALSWFDVFFRSGIEQINKDFNLYKDPQHSATTIFQDIIVKSVTSLEDMVMKKPVNLQLIRERIAIIEECLEEKSENKRPFQTACMTAHLDCHQYVMQTNTAQWDNLLEYLKAFRKPQVRHLISDSLVTMGMGAGSWGTAGIIKYSMPTSLEWMGMSSEESAVMATLFAVFAIPLTYGQRDAYIANARGIADVIRTRGRSICEYKGPHKLGTRVIAGALNFVGTGALTSMTVSLGMRAFADYTAYGQALFVASAGMLTLFAAYHNFYPLSIEFASNLTYCCQSEETTLKVRFLGACRVVKDLITRLSTGSTETLFFLLMLGKENPVREAAW
ncbi:MAG: hypothetical protein WCG04_04085 [Alphaproteobacteria bacterium]